MPHTPAHRARRSITAVSALLLIAASTMLQPPTAATAVAATAASARPRARPATPVLIERAIRRDEISDAEGALYLSWAFTAPERVPDAFASDTPWSGTLPLLHLRERLGDMGGSRVARTARSALRAGTFACPGTSGSLPNRRSSAHFHIQYSAVGGGLSVARYARVLETAWATEVGRFRWARPPRNPVSSPPGGRYPVRVEDLPPQLYGYVATTRRVGNNPATPWNDRDAAASCMVLNRDFAPFPGTTLAALRATAAHEFNHSIQFGYGALTGFGNVSDLMVEGLATQMEDEVFDSSDDSYNYLWPRFTTPMGQYGASPYPYWVVFRAMAERFGTGVRGGAEDVYQVFWEQLSRGTSTNLAALGRGFRASRARLGDVYHDASIALRFLANCSATKRRFCLEEGPAYRAAGGANHDHATLGPGASLARRIANDYALNWVGLPTGGSYDLEVTRDRGTGVLRVSIACRMGARVRVTFVGTATSSGDATMSGYDPSGCADATAVISNVRQTAPTPRSITRTGYTISVT
jgi:hypothetical protein